jgi:hypothetical protein
MPGDPDHSSRLLELGQTSIDGSSAAGVPLMPQRKHGQNARGNRAANLSQTARSIPIACLRFFALPA